MNTKQTVTNTKKQHSAYFSSLRQQQRRRWWQTTGGLAFGLCLSLLAAGKANAASFTFKEIANTRSGFTSLTPDFAINDSGTVVFQGTQTVGNQGIFTGSSGAITTIVDTNGLPSLFNPNDLPLPPSMYPRSYSFRRGLNTPSIDINNNGDVAFVASQFLQGLPFSESQLFISQAGSTPVALSTVRTDNSESTFIAGFDINDRGAVALLTYSSARFRTSEALLILRQDGSGQFIADADLRGDNLTGFNTLARPVINNQNTVIFQGVKRERRTVPGPPFPIIVPIPNVYASSDGSPPTAVTDGDPGFNLFNAAINDNGVIAFSDGKQLGSIDLSSSNRTINTIADTSGPFKDFGSFSGNINSGSVVAINNQGTIAFEASLKDGGQGIFVGADPVVDKVIAIGDPLFGSTVTNLSFFNKDLNNLGQIAFFAELADGTQGIFRADPVSTPKSVPEPSSGLAVLVLGTLGLGAVVKRQHKK